MEFHTAGVIGGGAWGTALAQSAAAAGLAVILQAREPEVIESIRTRRVNEAFLPGVELDSAINVTSDLADLADCDLILAVPPAQHMRATLTACAPYARPGLPIILCSKGIERGSLKLMTDVLPPEKAAMFQDYVRRTLQSDSAQVLEYTLDTRGGPRVFEARARALDVTFEGRRAVVLLTRDITERVRLEEEQRIAAVQIAIAISIIRQAGIGQLRRL